MHAITTQWQRAVIKVGSSIIAPEGKGCSTRYLLAMADFIHHSTRFGKQVLIVSSGSVAAGKDISQVKRGTALSIPDKQAMAAIGQSQVMQHWQRLFDQPCAQLLLTQADLNNAQRSQNASNTIETLLNLGALPVVNENDSVVVDELVVGDNDNLAAQVATLAKADLLVISSDVDGLFDKHPEVYDDAKLLSQVETITPDIIAMAGGTKNPIATGGMATKIEAAQKAQAAGIHTMIINGRQAASFEMLKQGQCSGTLFLAEAKTNPDKACQSQRASLANAEKTLEN